MCVFSDLLFFCVCGVSCILSLGAHRRRPQTSGRCMDNKTRIRMKAADIINAEYLTMTHTAAVVNLVFRTFPVLWHSNHIDCESALVSSTGWAKNWHVLFGREHYVHPKYPSAHKHHTLCAYFCGHMLLHTTVSFIWVCTCVFSSVVYVCVCLSRMYGGFLCLTQSVLEEVLVRAFPHDRC